MSKIEPDSIFQSKETSDDASLDECFHNSTNHGEKEDGSLGDELGLEGASEPKNLKEIQGHESGESGASKKSGQSFSNFNPELGIYHHPHTSVV